MLLETKDARAEWKIYQWGKKKSKATKKKKKKRK